MGMYTHTHTVEQDTYGCLSLVSDLPSQTRLPKPTPAGSSWGSESKGQKTAPPLVSSLGSLETLLLWKIGRSDTAFDYHFPHTIRPNRTAEF